MLNRRITFLQVTCCVVFGLLCLGIAVLPLGSAMLLLAMVAATLAVFLVTVDSKKYRRQGIVVGAVSGALYGFSSIAAANWSAHTTWVEGALAPASATLFLCGGTHNSGGALINVGLWTAIGYGLLHLVSRVRWQHRLLRGTATPGLRRKHSEFGIRSFKISLIAMTGGIALLCAALVPSFLSLGWLLGVFLLGTFAASIAGMVFAVIGLRQRDRNISLAVLGFLLNTGIVLFLVVYFVGIG